MMSLIGLTGLLGLPLLQEAAEVAAEAAASAPVQGLTVQMVAVIAIPILIQFLKQLIPNLEGKWLFYTNMGLNLLTAAAVMVNMGVPVTEAMAVGLGGGLAGSKAADVAKQRSVTISERHKKQ